MFGTNGMHGGAGFHGSGGMHGGFRDPMEDHNRAIREMEERNRRAEVDRQISRLRSNDFLEPREINSARNKIDFSLGSSASRSWEADKEIARLKRLASEREDQHERNRSELSGLQSRGLLSPSEISKARADLEFARSSGMDPDFEIARLKRMEDARRIARLHGSSAGLPTRARPEPFAVEPADPVRNGVSEYVQLVWNSKFRGGTSRLNQMIHGRAAPSADEKRAFENFLRFERSDDFGGPTIRTLVAQFQEYKRLHGIKSVQR
jgi:hypothetical protein